MTGAFVEYEPARELVHHLVFAKGKEHAHEIVDGLLARFSVVELAALAERWELWARPKQLAPPTYWRTWGFLTGRGWGKTKAISRHVNAEVYAGRAMLIGLVAQDEANAIDVQIQGPSGLIATAPPWFKPEWQASALRLVWPNGARAYVRTPEAPGKIRGLEYHLSWGTELQSWPVVTREEAFSNLQISTRLGYARLVWDATPKKRHPILLELLADAKRDPEHHVIIRGATHENAAHLGEGYVERLEQKYGGTSRGREELLGEMLEDSEGALWKQAWIDAKRRPWPSVIVRRVIAVDPAVTARAGSDRTGIIDAGLAPDGQMIVLGDGSGKHPPEAWAGIVLDKHQGGGCDCVVVETNKGGDLVTQNLRAAASSRGLQVIVLGKNEQPRRVAGIVYVREVHSRGEKADRAQPTATAYERGRVSHADGVDLGELEDTLTTWEPVPGKRSPDALDALVQAATELLGLNVNTPDAKIGFVGIEKVAQAVAGHSAPASNVSQALAAIIGGGGRGGRI